MTRTPLPSHDHDTPAGVFPAGAGAAPAGADRGAAPASGTAPGAAPAGADRGAASPDASSAVRVGSALTGARVRLERAGRQAIAAAIRTPARSTLTFAGAGLAVAGIGAIAATAGLTGTSAVAADNLGHAVAAASGAKATATPAGKGGAHQAGRAVRRARARHPHARTWAAADKIAASQTSPHAGHTPLPPKDKLLPAGTSGPQTWLPITTSRYANAKAIIGQALAKHMGVRAAVIAVATAMQESGLENVGYGTSDSLGLFQQRPSMGWGTPHQLMEPRYAADAFLRALRGYQASNPGWARQPLWQAAQGVQASGYPYAYAKWEAQAAHLVATITPRLI